MQGNDVADRLSKEAAMEAKEVGEETSVVTVQDIKRHARVSTRYKWQQRWDIWESGHDFFLCKPFLESDPRLDFPNIKMFKQILQLRTGYSKLNDYRHKLGQVETSVYTLLGYDSHVELSNWIDLICEEIGVDSTLREQRLKETQDHKLASQ